MKFIRKPQVVDAIQWTGTEKSTSSVLKWGKGLLSYRPDHFAIDRTLIAEAAITLQTIHGMTRARPGNWIIRGSCGLFSVLSEKLFEAEYEPYRKG